MKINEDLKIGDTSYALKDLVSKHINWNTSESTFPNQLSALKTWLRTSSAPIGTYLVNCGFNGAHYSAFVEKISNDYLSFLLIGYAEQPRFCRCAQAYSDDMVIPSKIVEQGYLGNNPNIDELHTKSGIYGLYNCTKTPNSGIGTLEVIFYSWDWVIQRFTTVEATPRMWERSFTGGTTWNAWIQRY